MEPVIETTVETTTSAFKTFIGSKTGLIAAAGAACMVIGLVVIWCVRRARKTKLAKAEDVITSKTNGFFRIFKKSPESK